MNPFDWFTRRSDAILTEAQQTRKTHLPPPQAIDETPLEQARLVVMDLETSGLDTRRDKVLSIGAVVIEQGAIDMGTQYECTLYRANHKVTESILIHGIPPSEIAEGMGAADALLDFMEFSGTCVFLAFHAGFDQRMLRRGLREDMGQRLQHPFIDVAEMAPMLCPDASVGRGGLDDWQKHFHLNNSQRHRRRTGDRRNCTDPVKQSTCSGYYYTGRIECPARALAPPASSPPGRTLRARLTLNS